MKKILSLILILAVAVLPCLLVSCSDDEDTITLANVGTKAEEYYNALSLSDATKEGKAEFAEYYRHQLQLLDEATTDDEAATKYAELTASLDAKYKEMFVDSTAYSISAQRAAHKAEIDAFAAAKNINAHVFGETQKSIFDGKVAAEKTKIDALDSTIAMQEQLAASKNTINAAVQYAVENANISPDSAKYAALQSVKALWESYKNAPDSDAKSLSGMLIEDRSDMESIYAAATVAICGEVSDEMLDGTNDAGHIKTLEAALAAFYEENKNSISATKQTVLDNLAAYFRGEIEGPANEKIDRSMLSNSGDAKLQEKYVTERNFIQSKTGAEIDSRAELAELQKNAALSIYNKYIEILANDVGASTGWTPIS